MTVAITTIERWWLLSSSVVVGKVWYELCWISMDEIQSVFDAKRFVSINCMTLGKLLLRKGFGLSIKYQI